MKTLRIKEHQEEKIRQLSMSFNKRLIAMGKQPIQDSTLTHLILDEALKRAEMNDAGRIDIR